MTEAKLNFYDNPHTITFTETVPDIDTFCKCTLSTATHHCWGASCGHWERKVSEMEIVPIISMQKTRKNLFMRKYCRWAVLSLAAPFSGLVWMLWNKVLELYSRRDFSYWLRSIKITITYLIILKATIWACKSYNYNIQLSLLLIPFLGSKDTTNIFCVAAITIPKIVYTIVHI